MNASVKSVYCVPANKKLILLQKENPFLHIKEFLQNIFMRVALTETDVLVLRHF